MSITRRELIRRAAVAIPAAGFLAGIETVDGDPLGLPIGVQSYPFRQRIKSGDLAGLCKDLAVIGVRSIELCSPGYAEFAGLANAKETRKIIEDNGLKCPSAHFVMDEFRDKHQEAIDWAKELGMTQMSTASLGSGRRGSVTMDALKAATDEYNKIGERAAKSGLQQALHDEGFELATIEGDGRLVYTVLFELLDPKLVKFQFQMSAMLTVGDPIMYFNKYPGRFVSMHLQGVNLNAPMPAPQQARGATPPAAGATPSTGNRGGGVAGASGGGGRGGVQFAVGSDSLDWPKIFEAAKVGGVKNYFVEQNWDPMVQSVAYLKTLKV
jgi:sugar phosphate isomerase/epimerase